MQYNFFIHNDKLIFNDHVNPRTGSVNVYECVFNINESVKGLQWFCVFNTEGINAIVTPIINNRCFIPVEVLKDENSIDIGCYATNGNTEDFKRINTNWLTFRPTKGAYMEGEAPETPSPDFWETLIFKTVPYIGSNGNWFVYDMESGQYKDTGKPSSGTGGGSDDLTNYYTKDETYNKKYIDDKNKEFMDFFVELYEKDSNNFKKHMIFPQGMYRDIVGSIENFNHEAISTGLLSGHVLSAEAFYRREQDYLTFFASYEDLAFLSNQIDKALDEIIALQVAKGGDAI